MSNVDFWYKFIRSILRGYITLFIDSVHVEGLQWIPTGPKIIIANHANVTDGFMLPFILQEKLHYFIQEETFTVPIIGKLFALADQIPVVIGQGREAIDAACERLAQGNSVVIFPEGKLNHARSFHRAGAGAAILALESAVPVVPVGFYVPDEHTRKIVTGKIHHRETSGQWQFGGTCFINIGEPWLPQLSPQAEVNYRAVRKITEDLMERVMELVENAKSYALLEDGNE